MKNVLSGRAIGAGLLLGSIALVGCGGEEPKSAPTSTTTASTPAAAPKTTTVATPAGDATASQGALPADFPKDVPVYAGAEIASAASVAGTNSALLMSSDPAEKVADFYKAELGKNGWATPQVVSAGPATVVRATKEKRQLAISIGKGQGDKTSIAISVTPMP